jgi:hypothetical protein
LTKELLLSNILKGTLIAGAVAFGIIVFLITWTGLGFNGNGLGGSVSFFLYAWLPLLSLPIAMLSVWNLRLGAVSALIQSVIYLLVTSSEWPTAFAALDVPGIALMLCLAVAIDYNPNSRIWIGSGKR